MQRLAEIEIPADELAAMVGRQTPFLSVIIPLVLVGIAVKLVQLAATRNGVGPMEYLTLAALVLFLLLTAFRLSRRALGRA